MLKLSVVYERGAILVVAALAQQKNRLLTKSITAVELSEAGNQCAICHVRMQPRHPFLEPVTCPARSVLTVVLLPCDLQTIMREAVNNGCCGYVG